MRLLEPVACNTWQLFWRHATIFNPDLLRADATGFGSGNGSLLDSLRTPGDELA